MVRRIQIEQARIEELAEPGGVCVSSAVYEQVDGKIDQTFDDLGFRKLKNIAQSVHVYRVREIDSPGLRHPAAFLSPGVKDQPLFDLDGKTIRPIPVVTGRCLCGDVKFEISGPTIGTGFCHCRICQRTLGGSINAWAAFSLEAVRFTSSKPTYYKSSLIAERGFCSNCGSSLTYRLLKPEPSQYLVICIASLDTPEDFAPTWHGGTENQMHWLDIHDDLPRMRTEDSPALHRAWESVGMNNPLEWKPL